MVDLLDDEALLDLRRRAARTDPAAVVAEERLRSPLAGANEALRAWEHAEPAPQGQAGSGVCPICNVRAGRQRCNACGRTVCPADVWTMMGLCKGCASAEDVARWHRPAAPSRQNWLEGGR